MTLLSLFSCATLLFLVSPTARAVDSNIDEYAVEFVYESFLSELDGDTIGILSEIGITEISFESVFSVSIGKVFNALFNIMGEAVKEPLRFLFVSTGIMTLTSLMTSFTKNTQSVQLVGGGVLALSIAVPIARVVSTSFSVLETLGAFTTAFSGVLCSIVSLSGGVASGIAYASSTVFFNGLFSGMLSGFSKPVINSMCSLGFLSCFDIMGLTRRFSEIIKKLFLFLISFIGTVFSGMVTLKGVLSDGADNITTRSVRFVVGRSVPVVGGTVSETYSALISSLSLIKSTVGAFGIITVVVIVMPTLIRLIMWALSIEISMSLFEVFGLESSKGFFSTLKDALILLLATIIMVTTIFIVSVGVVIALKGAAV
jgi:stage III sporulation protein AE